MKRTFLLWLGVLAMTAMPAVAQNAATPAETMVKVHGTVTNPTGAPQKGGTVEYVLITRASQGPGLNAETKGQAEFKVDSSGFYQGQVPAGIYNIVYRSEGMPKDKQADNFQNVKVEGADFTQDFDMSRQEYIDKLPAEERKQLEEMRKKNSAAMKANIIIKHLNEDLKHVNELIHEADGARAEAIKELGSGAKPAAVATKTAEIKSSKYTEIEALMQKDTQAKPDASILWAQLGLAANGLKKYDEAETAYKKALEVDLAAKKPNPAIQGMAHAGLGEVYARTGKVDQANAEFDAAGKANPDRADFYLRNAAVIFFQSGQADAQVAAADKAIQINPKDALLYYLKGQGLIGKATFDTKTNKIVLPQECADAYKQYLKLSPNGPYAKEVTGILKQAGLK